MKNCAVYTRVSTSMQAEKEYNSCEAQRDKILSYIKSQEKMVFYKEYSDPAFTGANIERPALKELLRDIANKKVDIVLAYKIDRLTRSSKDFYSLIDFFEKYGVSFISISECFDTLSASGRLLRNIMLTFAQFERELTGERTRDKMIQRAEKGLWNGKAPFGYKLIEKKLIIDKKDGSAVKEMFETFALTGSLMKTMALVKERGWKSPKTDKPITLNGVFHILRNPAYMGKMLWAGKIYLSNHEPLISEEFFNHAQSLTKEKTIKKKLYKEYFLRGILHCCDCGSLMTPHFTNKKKRRYYYYRCYKTVREGNSACSIKEVNAEKLENFLIENISRMAKDKQYIESLVFKMLHRRGGPAGFEPTEEAEKNLIMRVSQVLINFKNKIENATQVEKSLIFQNTIQEVSFSKEYLEMTVFINVTSEVGGNDLLNAHTSKRGALVGAGASDLRAPACSMSLILPNNDPSGIRTRVITVKG
ncbi:MAG: recombinase family protein [Thermodesulfobacteriota bacterium]